MIEIIARQCKGNCSNCALSIICELLRKGDDDTE